MSEKPDDKAILKALPLPLEVSRTAAAALEEAAAFLLTDSERHARINAGDPPADRLL